LVPVNLAGVSQPDQKPSLAEPSVVVPNKPLVESLSQASSEGDEPRAAHQDTQKDLFCAPHTDDQAEHASDDQSSQELYQRPAPVQPISGHVGVAETQCLFPDSSSLLDHPTVV
jgi:hypothetical protein